MRFATHRIIDWSIKLTAFVVACVYVYFLTTTLKQPIIEEHSFRQTQTAISVFYLLKEGLTLNYITPVVGFPWTIPFEAPVYQISVALFSYISPFSLDANGRIVSALYWIGSVVFGYKILRLLFKGNARIAWVFVILALGSPLYMFWSRTFMIETTALFFGLLFLWGTIKFVQKTNAVILVIAIFSGILCILAKATTWPAFVLAGGLYFLAHNFVFLKNWRPAQLTSTTTRGFLTKGAVLLFCVVITLLIGLSWTAHTDVLKLETLFGRNLTSTNLAAWNYGTLSDRASSALWSKTILARALPEALGQYWYIAILTPMIGWIGLDRNSQRGRAALAVLVCGVLFLLPFLFFTNLHMVHNYYQSAVSIFIIAAAAILIGTALSHNATGLITGILALGFIFLGQGSVFMKNYYPYTQNIENFENAPLHQMALYANKHVGQDSAILARGMSWTSQFHYYAERKGAAIELWFGESEIQKMAQNPALVFGELPLGGVADCQSVSDEENYPKVYKIVSDYVDAQLSHPDQMWTKQVFGHCVLHYRTDL